MTVVPIERESFFAEFTNFLRELKPHRELPAPAADTHLWEAGYLDSFALIQVIDRLEQMTGREIPVAPDTLATFFTLGRIYETYVEEAR